MTALNDPGHPDDQDEDCFENPPVPRTGQDPHKTLFRHEMKDLVHHPIEISSWILKCNSLFLV